MFGKNRHGQIIVLGGLPGTGKTTAALGIKNRLGEAATLIDVDVVRNIVTGKPKDEFWRGGEVSTGQKLKIYGHIIKQIYHANKQGNTAIVAATFVGKNLRRSFIGMASVVATIGGSKINEFWLVAPTEVTLDRQIQRRSRWLVGSPEPNNLSVAPPCNNNTEAVALERSIEKEWVRVDTQQPREHVVDQICAALNSPPTAPSGVDLGLMRLKPSTKSLGPFH